MKLLFPIVALVAGMAVFVMAFIFVEQRELDTAAVALQNDNGTVALKRLKPLAYLGNKSAQCILGSLYAFGDAGVSKNDIQAIYWFRRCGSMGLPVERTSDPAATSELVVAKDYLYGEAGVHVDRTEGIKWLKRAVAGGSKEAAVLLNKVGGIS